MIQRNAIASCETSIYSINSNYYANINMCSSWDQIDSNLRSFMFTPVWTHRMAIKATQFGCDNVRVFSSSLYALWSSWGAFTASPAVPLASTPAPRWGWSLQLQLSLPMLSRLSIGEQHCSVRLDVAPPAADVLHSKYMYLCPCWEPCKRVMQSFRMGGNSELDIVMLSSTILLNMHRIRIDIYWTKAGAYCSTMCYGNLT